MVTRDIISPAVPRTYAELRAAVESTIVKGQQDYEIARVRTYHETGRLIHEHVLLFKQRADHGARTIARLSADVKLHRSVLQRCVQFYQAMPNCADRRNLSWGHYRALITVDDPARRRALADEANRQRWLVEQLEGRIRELAPKPALTGSFSAADPVELLMPRRGTPGLHAVIDQGDGPAVDLGFRMTHPLGPGSKFTPGDIVRFSPSTGLRAGGYDVRRVDGATRAELFTYAVTVRRVVDGDTLIVALEFAPGFKKQMTLRLRGVDCAETSTAAGRAAKRFVESLVAPGDEVILSTTKPDKYDRSLADVFVRARNQAKNGESENEEIFLNNALLQNGHAVRYDGGPKDE
jgi:endonuclease YncB( thermonuclease family)